MPKVSPFEGHTSCEERKKMTAAMHNLIESNDRKSVKIRKASQTELGFYNQWGVFPWEVKR